jgi:hypothetical protein
MLRFLDEPDEHSLAILHAALTDALEEMDISKDDPEDSLEDFTARYPESAKCFTPALTETTLKDLLRASQESALYQLTDYHWLLLYEVLKNFTEVFNDEPEGVVGGKELVTKYGRKKVDFHDFIDCYFWDTDFLADPDGMINMGHESRQSMGLNQEAYAVIQRWAPHPEELALTKVDSEENL